MRITPFGKLRIFDNTYHIPRFPPKADFRFAPTRFTFRFSMAIPHIPILRWGVPYESLDVQDVRDHRTGELIARMSIANPGLIRRDLRSMRRSRECLSQVPEKELLEICRRAGDLFLSESLPFTANGMTQSANEYVAQLSATSGLPHTLCRRNMEKIYTVLTGMPDILRGLTRGLSAPVFDHGVTNGGGLRLCFYPLTDALGVVLPSNSPGVNSLWLPAPAMKIPVAIKPGSEEPLTPWRIIQAMIAAGCPAEAFAYYPAGHDGAGALMESCGRAIIFGDRGTIDRYAGQAHINVHGPGFSKILFDADAVKAWPDCLDVLVESVASNGGRSCINASTIVVPSAAREIAESLAKELAAVKPQPMDHDQAALSAFANPKMAAFIDAAIDEGLEAPGAVDMTAVLRAGPRKVELDGSTFLNPTVVYCERPDHPLANREFMFPYAAVIEVPPHEMPATIGPSLAVTAITEDRNFIDELLACPHIERLNIGRIPTNHVDWGQPHEGNLFEFLYRRRAIQM